MSFLAMTLRKSALPLHIAAIALVWTGLSFKTDATPLMSLHLAFLSIGLIFLTYGFNDFIDQSLFQHKIKTFIVFILATIFIFMGAFNLSAASLYSTISILTIGILYSIPFHFFKVPFQLKRVFVVKNILIGLCWALLLVIGSGSVSAPGVMSLLAFVFLQVFIGSIIRDISDLDEDLKDNTNSFPATIGIDKTLVILHFINIFSLFPFLFFGFDKAHPALIFLYFLPVIWRSGLILSLQYIGLKKILLQELNLFTCVLIFLPRALEAWII